MLCMNLAGVLPVSRAVTSYLPTLGVMVVPQLTNKFQQIESALDNMRLQIGEIQTASYEAETSLLRQENAILKEQIAVWVNKLVAAENKKGIKQASYWSSAECRQNGQPQDCVGQNGAQSSTESQQSPTPQSTTTTKGSEAAAATSDSADSERKRSQTDDSKPTEKSKKSKKDKCASGTTDSGVDKVTGTSGTSGTGEVPVDIGRLDLRVGRILSAVKHADADSLYVEQVDVGEEQPRTVVSGLVRYVPLDQMQNRLAVLLCNLKPSKMRGVTSQAMVMCASTPDRVEILQPPANSVPGDRVLCAGYGDRTPDPQLNPKKKVFEQVAPELKTDSDCRATYRGVVWEVLGKGVVTAPTLTNVNIK